MARILCIAVLAGLAGQTTGAIVSGTPIARVVSLLGKLESQIQNEGKKEAAEYDKFACYCKDQADNTLYAIETSREKISVLEAQLANLDAKIVELAGDADKSIEGSIKVLEDLIQEKLDAITVAEGKRETENDAYLKAAGEIADAIKAIEDATKAIKDKKAGVTDGKMNLLQDKLLEVLSTTAPTESQLSLIQSLGQDTPADPAAAHAYTYKSNSILGTLASLLAQFKEKKVTANVEEKEKLFAFDEKKQALTNEKNFADKERIQQVSDLADYRSDHATKTSDKDAETTAKEADDAFMKELTADCESKASMWDQRSSTRSDELTAIGQAITQLKEGVGKNYGSNALSFLQLRNSGKTAYSAVVEKALALVRGEADRLKSASLTGLSLKMNMGGGFAEVVQLIDDLIAKLEQEARDATSAKGQCDADMKSAVEKRDTNKLKMDSESATIAMKKAEKNRLAGEVQKLTAEIAELNKSILEATELRASEKSDNEQTIADATEGKAAIDNAISVLNTFYTGAAFVQQDPAVDRNGKSVADAPGLSFDSDYKGKQDASKGIIGILEVIQSDFQRTLTNTEADEGQAVTDFETFEKQAKTDISDKDDLKEEKEGDITAATSAITTAKGDLSDAEKLMNNALEELEKVTAMCMTGEGTFAERKKQREDEITALGGAKKILEDWSETTRD